MKHRRKFSLGIKIASILTCITILSAGFAAWWIVKLPTNITESGSFTVKEVEKKEIQITDVTLTNPTIIFGSTDVANPTWLGADGVATEALTATLTFTVSVKGNTQVNLDTLIDNITVTFAPDESTKADFNAALGAYEKAGSAYNGKTFMAAPVMALTSAQTVRSNTNYSASAPGALVIEAPAANSTTVTMTVTFDWGTITGGENPYKFFNGLSYSDDAADAAYAMLEKIYGLANVGYDIVISAGM